MEDRKLLEVLTRVHTAWHTIRTPMGCAILWLASEKSKKTEQPEKEEPVGRKRTERSELDQMTWAMAEIDVNKKADQKADDMIMKARESSMAAGEILSEAAVQLSELEDAMKEKRAVLDGLEERVNSWWTSRRSRCWTGWMRRGCSP